MRILFTGLKEEFEAFSRGLSLSQGVSVEFNQRRSSNGLNPGRDGEYDWVILNGNEFEMGKQKRLNAIQSGVCEEATVQDLGCHAEASKCGITWSENGVLQLHCKRHDALRKTKSSVGGGGEALDTCNIFEYQRPCARKN